LFKIKQVLVLHSPIHSYHWDMESQADKVTRWGAELQVLKDREQNEGTSSALDERIAILERRLFNAEQQGKFASPISVVLSHSYR
jgi:hypothetical protein